jgi:hypothetical protein
MKLIEKLLRAFRFHCRKRLLLFFRVGRSNLPPYQNRIKTLSVRAIWVVCRAKSRFPKLLKFQRTE